MKHYGDITKLNGHELPIVDVVTGGSPCQDLSVAGKRAGLDGERSGLFMEQVRVFKEMRNECIKQLRSRGADFDVRSVRPRFLVWENVPGAFSSNKGEDFRCVLEEICRIADKAAVIPMPDKGKWSTSGCVVGDWWSVAWRVHDAQFWGVPQRRKRIALVADFGSRGGALQKYYLSAKACQGILRRAEKRGKELPEILKQALIKQSAFKNEQGDLGGGGKGILIQKDHVGALSTLNNQAVVYGMSGYESNSMKSSNPHSGIYKADTTRTLDLNGGNPACNQGGMIVLEGNGQRNSHQGDGYKESETMYTLNTVEQHGVCYGESWDGTDISPTLTAHNANGSQRMPDKENFNAVVCYGLDRASFNQGQNAQYNFSVEEDLAQTIVAKGPGGVLTHK